MDGWIEVRPRAAHTRERTRPCPSVCDRPTVNASTGWLDTRRASARVHRADCRAFGGSAMGDPRRWSGVRGAVLWLRVFRCPTALREATEAIETLPVSSDGSRAPARRACRTALAYGCRRWPLAPAARRPEHWRPADVAPPPEPCDHLRPAAPLQCLPRCRRDNPNGRAACRARRQHADGVRPSRPRLGSSQTPIPAAVAGLRPVSPRPVKTSGSPSRTAQSTQSKPRRSQPRRPASSARLGWRAQTSEDRLVICVGAGVAGGTSPGGRRWSRRLHGAWPSC